MSAIDRADDSDFNLKPRYIEKKRSTVIGKWILDRRLGRPSMNGILQTMNLPQDEIEDHVKKDESMDIICHIDLTESHFKIRSFYVQDLDNQPRVEIIPIGKEIKEGSKTTLVTSNAEKNKVVMKKSMSTVCGFAEYHDTKEIVDPRSVRHIPEDFTESPEYYLLQTVTVKNHESRKEYTATRYYLPVEL